MTIEDIQELIKIDETRTLELKKTTGEIKDGMHSLCAMLNSDGGYVIFGVTPKTLKITGQMVSDSTRQEIAREIRKLEPFVNMTVEYVDVPGGDGQQVVILHADRHLYGDAPYVYDGRPYYKLESTTMLMPQQMYEDMLRKRDVAKFSWDAMVAEGMTIDNLDENRIRTAITMGIKNGRFRTYFPNWDCLEMESQLMLQLCCLQRPRRPIQSWKLKWAISEGMIRWCLLTTRWRWETSLIFIMPVCPFCFVI